VKTHALSPLNGSWVDEDGQKVLLPDDLSLEMKTKQNWVMISIQDSGIGIEEKNLVRIFDPFEQGTTLRPAHFRVQGLGFPSPGVWWNSMGEKSGRKAGAGKRFHVPNDPPDPKCVILDMGQHPCPMERECRWILVTGMGMRWFHEEEKKTGDEPWSLEISTKPKF